ncbi:MAG: M28 family peptidase [Bacteroidales bacterium]|jgi:leucyl aminopeptidase|nr:M28 family peptidase [Bacteroidales bacterium]
MKKTILLLLALCITSMMFADNFVMIKVKDQQNLRELFNKNDVNIHYYNDNFVLATSENLTDNMILLDEKSFEDNELYYIVYCEKENQQNYIERENVDVLFSDDNLLIVKSLNKEVKPAKNDGMIVVDKKLARLAQARRDFPSITEEDEMTRTLMDEVSIENLTATVQHLQDYGRRQYNTAQAYEAGQWIYEQFENLGLDVEQFEFKHGVNESSPNIIATQWGTKYPDKYVICGSHYDSERSGHGGQEAPGADDNATGVATVLETARILSEYSFEYSIIYCSFSAEEIGLVGSKAYAEFCVDMGYDIVAYFNNDMNGYLHPGNEIHVDLIYPENVEVLGEYYKNVAGVYFPEMEVRHIEFTKGTSDHESFNNNGFMGIYPFEDKDNFSPYIHTLEDVIGTSVNSFEQSQRFTQMNIACVATLATLSTENIIENEYDNVTVFPNPAKNILTLTADTEGMKNVKIVNSLGQIVKEFSFETKTTVDIKDLNNGVYFVKILGENSLTKKIVIRD